MLECPNCKTTRLVKLQNEYGFFWGCPKCDGRAVNLSLLRKKFSHKFLANLWGMAYERKGPFSRRCPMCGKHMNEISAETGTPKLDVCKACQFVWFDPKEYEQIPLEPIPPPETKLKDLLPLEAREKLALREVQRIEDEARSSDSNFGDAPDESWKNIPAIFGLPVEYENKLNHLPIMTWLIIIMTCIISIGTFANSNHFIRIFGFIPAQPFRDCGLTMISSFFLHAGWYHLLGNMYFLYIFGDNVEDILGKWKFLLLLLLSTLAGDLLHMMIGGKSEIPCIGASGGISGIITFYALQFPGAKLGILFRFGHMFRWISFPAVIGLVLWILMQAYGVWQQLNGFSNVSALAHLGGAAVGFALWIPYASWGIVSEKEKDS